MIRYEIIFTLIALDHSQSIFNSLKKITVFLKQKFLYRIHLLKQRHPKLLIYLLTFNSAFYLTLFVSSLLFALLKNNTDLVSTFTVEICKALFTGVIFYFFTIHITLIRKRIAFLWYITNNTHGIHNDFIHFHSYITNNDYVKSIDYLERILIKINNLIKLEYILTAETIINLIKLQSLISGMKSIYTHVFEEVRVRSYDFKTYEQLIIKIADSYDKDNAKIYKFYSNRYQGKL